MRGLRQKKSTVHVLEIGQAVHAVPSIICEQNFTRVLPSYSAGSYSAFARSFGGRDCHIVMGDCV
jgi:hypothetical protein